MAASSTSQLATIALTSYNKDVYEPSDDTFVLADALLKILSRCPRQSYMCIEVGCGSGFISCSLDRILCSLDAPHHVVALDISPHAIAATRTTLQMHGVQHADVVQGSFQHVLAGTRQAWDIVVFNPPYVPTPDEELARTDIARAWAGGCCGRVVIDQFLMLAPRILAPKGQLFLVAVDENDPQGILDMLQRQDSSLQGSIVMTRRADEEHLSVLHVQRR